jgi:tetratricopeptide (TPR) repeat protein
MRALRATSEIEGAIEAGERAYELSPDDASRELIDLHNERARTLLEGDPTKEEDAIGHARRVLEIDSTNAEACKFLSGIYLHRAEIDIQASQLETAQQAVQQLVEPIRIIDDEDNSDHVRQLWLKYSRQLTEGESPQWVGARQPLDILETWGIMNEEIIERYNEIGLDEAGAFLEQDDLGRALDTLRDRLKSPRPNEKLTNLLTDYNERQQNRLRWEQAENTLKGLQHLVDDDQDTQSALTTLYHKWGNYLCSVGQFEKAIDIYWRGRPESEFKPKIEQAQQEKEEQHIQQQLNDAQAALDQKQFAKAIEHLTRIPDKAGPRVRDLIHDTLVKWTDNGEWANGAEALKELKEAFVDDPGIRSWYVNWLYLWAQALLKGQVTAEAMAEAKIAVEAMVQAKTRCQEILTAGVDTLVLDLRGASTSVSAEKDLRHEVCTLYTEISLRQAQICLRQDDVTEAQTLFKEALDLPLPPENLQERIRETLRGFVQEKVTKEEWEQATRAFAVLQELKLYDGNPEIEQDFCKVIMMWACLRLKADQPVQAFEVLNRLGPEAKTELRQWGRGTLYEFCCLYAGRDQEDLWREAQNTVDKLGEWLGLADRGQIDDLRFVVFQEEDESSQNRQKAQSTPRDTGSPKDIKDIRESVEKAQNPYEAAKRAGLTTLLLEWVNKLMLRRLEYGVALLDNNQLMEAMQNYEDLLSVGELTEEQRADVNLKITNALYVYSERMLHNEKWDEARKALEQLKGLNLPPREGKLQDLPDRRVDGAIQRVILDQARAWLKDTKFDETCDLLQKLPRPWPDKAVKEVIRAESEERSQRNDWENAVEIYRRLDEFLIADRDHVRDQEAREWLVTGQEGWGRYLEGQGLDREAATQYYEGLLLTRKAAAPRNVELAGRYIEAKLRLAQKVLEQSDLALLAPNQTEQAIKDYQDILRLEPPEHTDEHESRLNQALYAHACKLAEKECWDRAYQILDDLDKLYPSRTETDDTLFATWWRELFLKEISVHLRAGKVDEAIARLGELKECLVKRNAPKASWPDSRDVAVKVGQEFYERWREGEDWEPAARFLDELAQRFDGDHEVIGWEVDVLCRWGGWLRQKDNLEEAVVRYKGALAQAPQQELVPAESIERDLLNTQLMKAEKALGQHDLAAAKETYRDILKKPAEHLDRGSRVCDALSQYSNSLAGKTPPQWTDAQAALQVLKELPVDQNKVLEYRQNLTLRHMDAMLEQDDVKGAFTVLEALERPWVLKRIKGTILSHTKRWVEGGTWRRATETFECFGDLSKDDDAARSWIVGELINLGDSLARKERQNLEGADEAYHLAHRFDPESAGNKLVTTRLKRASQALDRDDLRGAENFFRSALEIKGEHPGRADKMREVLQDYSGKVSGREPPGWDLAQGALEMITSLGLQTNQTQLNEADFWLKQAKIDQGFEIFDDLLTTPYGPDIQSQLDLEISRIVRRHVTQYAQRGQWSPAKKIIEKVEQQWPNDDKRQDWLKAVSGILAVAEQTTTDLDINLREHEQTITDLNIKLREHEQTITDLNIKFQELQQTIEKQEPRIEEPEKSEPSEPWWVRYRKIGESH